LLICIFFCIAVLCAFLRGAKVLRMKETSIKTTDFHVFYIFTGRYFVCSALFLFGEPLLPLFFFRERTFVKYR
jgi:hypothetical protein